MNTDLLIVVVAVGVATGLLCIVNWRLAFLAIAVVGFAQDPLRKLILGEPVVLVMLSSGVMLMAMLAAMTRVGPVTLNPLTQGDRATQLVLTLFIILVLAQAGIALLRFGSPIISAIGLFAYLSPIPAVWLAYCYIRSEEDVWRFFKVYIFLAIAAVITVLLAKFGVSSSLFEQVGESTRIYFGWAGRLDVYSGIMRSPEVAAWHAGAAACFLIVISVSARRFPLRWITPVLILVFIAAALLTGRRKVLVVAVVFMTLYWLLLVYYRQGSGMRALVASSVVGLVLSVGLLTLAPDTSHLNPYLARGQTVFGDIADRTTRLGFGSVGWAINAAGFWGLGAGTVGQGAQYFGGAETARGAAEGGLGKIVVELGVPGLVLCAILIGLLVRNAHRVLSLCAHQDPELLRLNIGLIAFCAANFPVFVGASQIYGDPFVLFVLGSCFGFVMATPKIIRLRLMVAHQSVATPGNQYQDAAVVRQQ